MHCCTIVPFAIDLASDDVTKHVHGSFSVRGSDLCDRTSEAKFFDGWLYSAHNDRNYECIEFEGNIGPFILSSERKANLYHPCRGGIN